jgi:hypothetical protein
MADLTPWNKGRNVGQKRALRPQDVWMIRGRLRAEGRKRDLALLNLAIDSNYLPAISSPCKSKMSATIVCIGVLRTPMELRSGVAKAPAGRVRSRAKVVLQRTRNRPTWDTASRLQGRCLSIPSRSGYSDPP